ncbi:MAG: anaerobic sulfatase maturase [Victivallales bacterium]|nr:anaerobic sulfatase maturase [Victivallales bacterium]
MPETSPDYTLLIKPASGDCNLHCDYCFYACKCLLYPNGSRRMAEATLKRLIESYFGRSQTEYTFAWQGGEPTLMGQDFYRNAVEIQNSLKPANATVRNVLQTNGVLLNDEWAKFLHDNDFLVGVSLDGPAALHDRYRRHVNGHGSQMEVMTALKCLKKRKVETNILTLVSEANCRNATQIYKYLKDNGFKYHQYIECVECDDANQPLPFSLKPGQWGSFLCDLFDAWYPNDVTVISIRLFDSIVSRLVTGLPTVCPMGGNCCNYLVIEHNGDVYPCDFHVLPEWKLGNVMSDSLRELFNSPKFLSFGQKKQPDNPNCLSCRYSKLCMADCPKHRRFTHDRRSALCQDWLAFYDHTITRFEQLAAWVKTR